MGHTKEKWFFKKLSVSSFDIQHDHGVNQIEHVANVITEDNASRIVACVNACAGIPTDKLEEHEVSLCGKSYVEIEQQRDELLAVMQFILRGMDGGHIKCAPYFDFDPDAANIEFKHPAEMIRDAIAKATA